MLGPGAWPWAGLGWAGPWAGLGGLPWACRVGGAEGRAARKPQTAWCPLLRAACSRGSRDHAPAFTCLPCRSARAERKRVIDKHTNLATALLQQIKARRGRGGGAAADWCRQLQTGCIAQSMAGCTWPWSGVLQRSWARCVHDLPAGRPATCTTPWHALPTCHLTIYFRAAFAPLQERQLDAFYALEEDCLANKADCAAVCRQLQVRLGSGARGSGFGGASVVQRRGLGWEAWQAWKARRPETCWPLLAWQ